MSTTIDKLNDKLDAIIELISGSNINVAPCKYTLFEWLDKWLQVYKAPNVQPITLYALDVAIRVHIRQGLPNFPLNRYDGLQLQKFLLGISGSRTRKTVFDVLNGSFRTACNLKLIRDNPMSAVKIPVHKRKRGSALSDNEIIAFRETLRGHWAENYFLFLLYTGCRRSEALRLNVKDIDPENNRLHIRGTKTELSDRIIPLFDNVARLLDTVTTDDNGFFFPYRGDTVTHTFKKLCPEHKLHDLRHTFATKCLETRIPLKVVQTWLGHSEIDTTADIYSHVTDKLNFAEAERINNFFSRL